MHTDQSVSSGIPILSPLKIPNNDVILRQFPFPPYKRNEFDPQIQSFEEGSLTDGRLSFLHLYATGLKLK